VTDSLAVKGSAVIQIFLVALLSSLAYSAVDI